MLDDDEQRVLDDIAVHGWHGIYVPADEEGPGFFYSIGLDDWLGVPELIVFGLRKDVMHFMIWEMTKQIRAGRNLETDAVFANLIADFPCVLKAVHPTWMRDFFGYAGWYYHYQQKLERLRAFQIFWPGKLDGLFPWQAGRSNIVIEQQPLLYEPKPQNSLQSGG